MADIFTKAKRSDVMSRIKGTGNMETELRLIGVFKTLGITGWRRRWPLEGKPDFVFPKLKLAVFVDGCFWHGCPIHATEPKTNAEFWREKLARNQTRDRFVTRTLRRAGWRVLRIWGHELTKKNTRRLAARFRRADLVP
jgi:DNA mismatch endonuclease (patch repair protein)